MSAQLYIEGAESKQDQIRCREGFRKLLEKLGFEKRMPRLRACGSRNAAFDDFKTALSAAAGHFVALLIDSEDPMADPEQAWAHLQARDHWNKPSGATDEQVFLMTTCMETWIVADRATLKTYYGHKLQESALPATDNLEHQRRGQVQDKLTHATRECSNAYRKGKRSFAVVGALNPQALMALLPAFARMKRILGLKL